jgi:hypothetical protein
LIVRNNLNGDGFSAIIDEKHIILMTLSENQGNIRWEMLAEEGLNWILVGDYKSLEIEKERKCIKAF